MIIGLIVLLVAAAVIAKALKSGPSSTVQTGTRAVVVPTADAARTVVVAPCGTGANVLSAGQAVRQTIGSTTVQLPHGQGERVVLVPPCSGSGHGAVASTSGLPSAVFVPAPGSPLPVIGSRPTTTSPQAGRPDTAQFELTVPAGSAVRTIVLSPCQKLRPSGPAQQLLSAAGNSSTAVAPAC